MTPSQTMEMARTYADKGDWSGAYQVLRAGYLAHLRSTSLAGEVGEPAAWLYDRVDWPNKGDVKPALSWDDPTPVLLDGDTGITNIRPLYERLAASDTEAERRRLLSIQEAIEHGDKHAARLMIKKRLAALAKGGAA